MVVIAPQHLAAEAVRAVEAGARAYLTYPLDPEEVRHSIRDLEFTLLLESEVDYLRDEFWLSDLVESIRTDSPAMRDPNPTVILVPGLGLIAWGRNKSEKNGLKPSGSFR